jgi:hypothetical protein
MNSAVLSQSNRARNPAFAPIMMPSARARQPRRRLLSVEALDATEDAADDASEISESLKSLSTEFPTFGPMSSSEIQSFSEQSGTLHRLRLYTGSALIGAVICGLAFGWTEHREMFQWIGAGVAMVAYALARRRN